MKHLGINIPKNIVKTTTKCIFKSQIIYNYRSMKYKGIFQQKQKNELFTHPHVVHLSFL